MPALTGGQALVQSLKREGVTMVFALPGVQLDWAFDALYEERESIRVIHTRHEQATSFMADGYARAGGRPGVCLVVPGPGLLNAAAGLATAYACSSPVLCIAGQIPSDLIGRGRGVLHEIKDQMAAAASVTKWAARASRPEEVPGLVREAFRQMTTGRPRPVEIEISPDVLAARAEVQLLEPGMEARSAGDPDLLEQAARALGRAEKPVIFAGGGILTAEAWEELQRLAEALEAPVVLSPSAKGALSDRHHLAQPPLAGPELLPQADVVLAVGTRFVAPATAPWGVRPHQTVLQLDADPEEVGRNYAPTIGIVGDAKRGLAELERRVARHNRARPSRREEMMAVKARVAADLDRLEPQASLAKAIRAALPEDGIFVSEMTQVGYWANQGFPVYRPRTYLTAGYQGTLGYGFPTALGAQVANPDRAVVAIAGDGGFLYGVQELATMVQHKINLVVVVFNDNAYGNVLRTQRQSFGGRTIASELHNPDFVRLAESFGVKALRARDPAGLQGLLRQALAAGEPALIEVPVGPMPQPSFMGGGQASPPPVPQEPSRPATR